MSPKRGTRWSHQVCGAAARTGNVRCPPVIKFLQKSVSSCFTIKTLVFELKSTCNFTQVHEQGISLCFYILKLCCRNSDLNCLLYWTLLQVNLGLPRPQRVVQLPDIAWGHYTSGLGDFEREFCDKKCKTRRLKLMFDKGIYTTALKNQMLCVM